MSVESRVRRPDHHEALIQRLRTEAGFPAIRDVLLFAAALGFLQGRRSPFSKSGEPIRYDILVSDGLADSFVSMLAAVTSSDDPEILDPGRLSERIVIFEEFSNGGLEYLQEQINSRKEPYDVIARSICVEALCSTGPVEGATIEELLEGF